MFDFLNIKKAISLYGQKIKEVQSGIEKLRQEREDVLFAPTSRDDAKAAMASWIASRATVYRTSITKGIGDLALHRGALEDPALFAEMAARLPLVHKNVSGPTDGPVDLMVCALFGDALLMAFNEVIHAMEWPEGSLSNVQRKQKLAAIDAKLAELLETEKQLVLAGADAGISFETV